MPKVFLHRAAQKKLNKFSLDEKEKIRRALLAIEKDPFNNNLNIRKMVSKGHKFYRVRLGDIRIVYEIVEKERIVIVRDIDFRGNVY